MLQYCLHLYQHRRVSHLEKIVDTVVQCNSKDHGSNTQLEKRQKKNIRTYRLVVRIAAFQAVDMGSNPVECIELWMRAYNRITIISTHSQLSYF